MQLHVASLASALNLGYFTWIIPGCFFRHEMSDCYSYGYQSTVFELGYCMIIMSAYTTTRWPMYNTKLVIIQQSLLQYSREPIQVHSSS